jgi:hypothetical protein
MTHEAIVDGVGEARAINMTRRLTASELLRAEASDLKVTTMCVRDTTVTAMCACDGNVTTRFARVS